MDHIDNNLTKSWEPRVGMEFDTVEMAWQFWINYGAHIGFHVRKLWINTNKSNGHTSSARFVCSKEGVRKPDKRDSHTKCPRAETRTNCKSRMGIVYDKEANKYKLHDFVPEHTHVLHTPETIHMMPSQRKITDVQAIEIDLADDSGIKTKASYELMSRHAGGRFSVGYTLIDQKNYLRQRRQREMKYGEAGTLLRYFQQQSLDNPSFYYATQLDNEEQITNIFWADARMIMDYSYFGDVVTFDTTFNTNNKLRPLGIFIGFNHHRKIAIFGASLLYDETSESFEWLFRTFLEAHNQKEPITLFTDQDQAMANALRNVMPNVHHGLCTWHIMQNAVKHVGNIVKDDCSLLKDFKKCMYEYENEQKFEESWAAITDHYKLGGNRWWKGIYEKRGKWAICYMKSVYTLGMRSTQLSESLNGDLKVYLKPDLDILHFFKNFERVVEDKRYNELQSEYASREKLPRVRMNKSPLLQQVAQMYTPSIFELFQEEFDWSLSAIVKHHSMNESIHTYLVVMFDQHGEYIVTRNTMEETVFCSCKKFETFGILCSHCLKVLDVMDVKILPKQYILKRWTREAKKEVVQDANGKVVYEFANLSAAQKYRSLCSKLVKLASKACEYEETYEFLSRSIDELCQKVENMCVTQNKAYGDDCRTGTSMSNDGDILEKEVANVKGLKKKVGTKGRKRLKSWVEKLPKNKKVASKGKNIAFDQLNEKEECHSIANELFEKFKDFLSCNRQEWMNESWNGAINDAILFDQEMDTNNHPNRQVK